MLLAFGWLHLPMLGWLAAAAAPLLIHLWSRRRYREVPWAAMRFLLAAVRRRYRRLQLEQWLLLLVRTLLVALLVLAVAGPYLDQTGPASPASGTRVHRVLVLDGSYSMAYRPAGESLFDRAKAIASRIVEASSAGDAFTLVLMATPPRVVVGTPAFDSREILEEIGNLEVSHGSFRLPAVLAAVGRIVSQTRREEPRLLRQEICIFTDLNRVGWRLEGAAAAESRRLASQLAEMASLMIVDLGQEGAENLAVTSLRMAEPLATAQRPVRLEAEVRNFGGRERRNLAVDLLVDGRRVEQQLVTVPAGGKATASFAHSFAAAGEHTVDAQITGDALDIDNHRWLSAPVKPSIRVLCIDGRPSGEPFEGATGYLRVALAPSETADEAGLMRVDVAAESALVERQLGDYDCVFLADVAQFTAGEARVLRSYVERGGSLVFFLGPQVVAEQYNLQLGEGNAGILPARLGLTVDNPPGRRLDPLGYRHALVDVFRGQEKAGLLTTPVARYIKLAPLDRDRARVALTLAGGDPLIVEKSLGRGRVALVATSADMSWTAMPVWPSYVPLVQELLAWSVGGQLDARNVVVGDPLEGNVVAPLTGMTVEVRTPRGDGSAARLHGEAGSGVWSYAETDTSGIYTARFGTPPNHAQRYAVNLDTTESDLARLGPEELREEVWPGVVLTHQTSWQDLETAPTVTLHPEIRLDMALLYGVLGLVFLETFLAWFLGNRFA